MRVYSQSALLVVLLSLATTPGAFAQKAHERSDHVYQVTSQSAVHAGALTLDEGLAILSSALDSRHHAGFRTDCSHFVHGLYDRAGFPYAYAPSSDLYAGIDEFRRVTHPQPGDLAVWRGHAGIVVNAGQHTFFSLLRSGPGVASYESSYWKKKGRPHFFRYVKAAPGRVLAGAVRNVSLRPALEDAEAQQDASEDPASEALEERSNRTISGRPLRNQSLSNQSLSNQSLSNQSLPNQFSSKQTSNAPITTVVVVNAGHPRPEQVADAFLRACTDSERNFRGRDLSKATQGIIVFDRFKVKKVHIAGTQAWADVQIEELASVSRGQSQARSRSERLRWPLIRRDATNWELVLPRDIVYLPQHIAVRLLAQQLARLTEETPAASARAQEKTELAQLLNVLLHN